MSNKVILIGLDGADPDFIISHRSKLATINYLIKNGVFGKLESTIPPFTAAAWSAAMSGMNPGKTGVVDFLERDFDKGEDKLINSRSVAVPRIWQILTAHNKKSGIVAVPLTYPVERINGFMISGFLTPGKARDFTYPPELLKDLPEGYRTSLELKDYQGKLRQFLRNLYEFTGNQFKLVENLISKKEWDLFVYVLSGTDWIQHFFSRPSYNPLVKEYERIILQYFQYMDGFLENLIDKLQDSTSVIIISDHGFGKFASKYVYLNTWLKQKGYLCPKTNLKTRIRNFVGENLRSIFAKLPFAMRIKEKIPQDLKGFVLQSEEVKRSEIDWDRTKAYFSHAGYSVGYIRIDRKISSDGKYYRLRDEIVSGIRNLKDPISGKDIVAKIFKREELYSGPYLEKIPDIVFNFNDEYAGQDIITGNVIREIPFSSRPGAEHKMDGIFIVKGNEFKKGFQCDVRITDIIPTIYHLMDIPLPEDIDGKVLNEIFCSDSEAKKRSVRYQVYEGIKKKAFEWDKQDKEDIEEQLRQLGYV